MTATLTTRLSVNTKENFLVRIGLIERALKINPNYPVGLECGLEPRVLNIARNAELQRCFSSWNHIFYCFRQ